MAAIRRLLLAAILLPAFLHAQIPAPPAETYTSFITPYQAGSLSGGMKDKHPIVFVLTLIDESSTPPNIIRPASMTPGNQTIWRFAVSINGSVSMTRYTPYAIQGGGTGDPMPSADFKRLKTILAALPPDHAQLPPRVRRMIIQSALGGNLLARVYDRANAPEPVLELFRLVGADTWPLTDFPDFAPNQRWSHDQLQDAGVDLNEMGLTDAQLKTLATSPDHTLTVREEGSMFLDPTTIVENLAEPVQPPQRTDIETILRIRDAAGKIVHEFHEPMRGNKIIYIHSAFFTPDGTRLVALSSIPDIRVYDTTTWQRLPSLPAIPPGAVAFYPSPDWSKAVDVMPSGEVDLLDTRTARTLARVDAGLSLQSAVFSTDNARVAIVTGVKPDVAYRGALRLYDTRSGTLLHELRPLEATPHNGFGEPIWWHHGTYLLVPTREGRAGGGIVGIWNTHSGRYRGALAGCLYPESPFTRLAIMGDRLFKSCNDELLMWNVDTALQSVAAFESSLPN